MNRFITALRLFRLYRRAGIFTNGKQHHLGTFKTVEEANRAYVTAKRQLHQGGVI